jgi:hypothetical protein
MMRQPPTTRLLQDIATARRDGTTIEVKHGIYQQIVQAAWSGQRQAFVREGDPYRLTLHRVTGRRPVAKG